MLAGVQNRNRYHVVYFIRFYIFVQSNRKIKLALISERDDLRC